MADFLEAILADFLSADSVAVATTVLVEEAAFLVGAFLVAAGRVTRDDVRGAMVNVRTCKTRSFGIGGYNGGSNVVKS